MFLSDHEALEIDTYNKAARLLGQPVSEGPGSVEPPDSLCNIEGCAYTKHEKGPHSWEQR